MYARSVNCLLFWSWFSFSVAVGEIKISGTVVPATVAPAEPSLNDCFCSFVWDNRAQNHLLPYIHNIQLSREVDYLSSRDRLACSERNECSCFVVAVVAVVPGVAAQNCCCDVHQRLPPTLSSSVRILDNRINTPINTIDHIVASTTFRENWIPQPYVDSQEIFHFSTGIGSNTKTILDNC